MATMTAEHWTAAFVAMLCQITNASPDEAEAEAANVLAKIDPPIPDDLDVIAHVGTAERAALAVADRWRYEAEVEAGDLFEEAPEADTLDPAVDPVPDPEADSP